MKCFNYLQLKKFIKNHVSVAVKSAVQFARCIAKIKTIAES